MASLIQENQEKKEEQQQQFTELLSSTLESSSNNSDKMIIDAALSTSPISIIQPISLSLCGSTLGGGELKTTTTTINREEFLLREIISVSMSGLPSPSMLEKFGDANEIAAFIHQATRSVDSSFRERFFKMRKISHYTLPRMGSAWGDYRKFLIIEKRKERISEFIKHAKIRITEIKAKQAKIHEKSRRFYKTITDNCKPIEVDDNDYLSSNTVVNTTTNTTTKQEFTQQQQQHENTKRYQSSRKCKHIQERTIINPKNQRKLSESMQCYVALRILIRLYSLERMIIKSLVEYSKSVVVNFDKIELRASELIDKIQLNEPNLFSSLTETQWKNAIEALLLQQNQDNINVNLQSFTTNTESTTDNIKNEQPQRQQEEDQSPVSFCNHVGKFSFALGNPRKFLSLISYIACICHTIADLWSKHTRGNCTTTMCLVLEEFIDSKGTIKTPSLVNRVFDQIRCIHCVHNESEPLRGYSDYFVEEVPSNNIEQTIPCLDNQFYENMTCVNEIPRGIFEKNLIKMHENYPLIIMRFGSWSNYLKDSSLLSLESSPLLQNTSLSISRRDLFGATTTTTIPYIGDIPGDDPLQSPGKSSPSSSPSSSSLTNSNDTINNNNNNFFTNISDTSELLKQQQQQLQKKQKPSGHIKRIDSFVFGRISRKKRSTKSSSSSYGCGDLSSFDSERSPRDSSYEKEQQHPECTPLGQQQQQSSSLEPVDTFMNDFNTMNDSIKTPTPNSYSDHQQQQQQQLQNISPLYSSFGAMINNEEYDYNDNDLNNNNNNDNYSSESSNSDTSISPLSQFPQFGSSLGSRIDRLEDQTVALNQIILPLLKSTIPNVNNNAVPAPNSYPNIVNGANGGGVVNHSHSSQNVTLTIDLSERTLHKFSECIRNIFLPSQINYNNGNTIHQQQQQQQQQQQSSNGPNYHRGGNDHNQQQQQQKQQQQQQQQHYHHHHHNSLENTLKNQTVTGKRIPISEPIRNPKIIRTSLQQSSPSQIINDKQQQQQQQQQTNETINTTIQNNEPNTCINNSNNRVSGCNNTNNEPQQNPPTNITMNISQQNIPTIQSSSTIDNININNITTTTTTTTTTNSLTPVANPQIQQQPTTPQVPEKKRRGPKPGTKRKPADPNKPAVQKPKIQDPNAPKRRRGRPSKAQKLLEQQQLEQQQLLLQQNSGQENTKNEQQSENIPEQQQQNNNIITNNPLIETNDAMNIDKDESIDKMEQQQQQQQQQQYSEGIPLGQQLDKSPSTEINKPIIVIKQKRQRKKATSPSLITKAKKTTNDKRRKSTKKTTVNNDGTTMNDFTNHITNENGIEVAKSDNGSCYFKWDYTQQHPEETHLGQQHPEGIPLGQQSLDQQSSQIICNSMDTFFDQIPVGVDDIHSMGDDAQSLLLSETDFEKCLSINIKDEKLNFLQLNRRKRLRGRK